ncbi:MAG: methyltransferase domain-containing protein [Gammaproteobacteria bacterium]|nr:methyltransferase domain-containing protein [Gammaproteobacteria bacterium]MDP6695737.1 methyltransferase domain-containing protein [Gammaproteobacteria bacterium]
MDTNTHTEVQRYYGQELESSADLKTTACCTADEVPGYVKALLATIHDEVLQRYYGCGLVLPEALEGLRVLDLGCGAGRDVYLLSALVGAEGSVVGVDMTPEQLAVAQRHQEFHAKTFGYAQSNVDFIEANIEKLEATDLEDNSFDLIVSNCVINLAVDKAAVLRSAHRLLKPGGEMYFSDIYADRRIPEHLVSDPVLYGECLAGALYWNDFRQIARESGFRDPRLLKSEPVEVTDTELRRKLGTLHFDSATFRLFRLAGLDAGHENYGQQAVYRGTIPEYPEEFRLDERYRFRRGRQTAICGNTYRLLGHTRFGAHFDLLGDDSVHLGEFSDTKPADAGQEPADTSAAGGCC